MHELAGLAEVVHHHRLGIDAERTSMVYTVQDSFYDYKLRNQAMMAIALAGFRRIVFCSRAAYDSLPSIWKWLVRGRWTAGPERNGRYFLSH